MFTISSTRPPGRDASSIAASANATFLFFASSVQKETAGLGLPSCHAMKRALWWRATRRASWFASSFLRRAHFLSSESAICGGPARGKQQTQTCAAMCAAAGGGGGGGSRF
eukprot:2835228-Prymnesium_polylepis.2